MQYTPESVAAALAAKTSTSPAAKPATQATATEAAAWLREFRAWTANGAAGSGSSAGTSSAAGSPADVTAVLERLAGSFPGATITTASLGSFGSVRDHYAASSATTSVNLDAATATRMGADPAFAQQVEKALSGLLAAGSQQSLVAAGGAALSRHVSVSGDGVVRYTEVQRTATGTQMAVTSLSLAAAGEGEAGASGSAIAGPGAGGAELDRLMADLAAMADNWATAGSGAGAGGGAAGGSPFDFLFQSNFQSTSASYRGGDGRSPSSAEYAYSFSSRSSASWRLESYLSPSAARNIMTAQQSFQTRELTLQVTGRQWPAGRTSGTVDLQSYMELMGLTDPLVLDLAGDGINLKSAEDGVYFDIHGDGRPVRTAFIQGDDAFLYLDENGNGTADSGSELFGDHGGYANGFDKLARYDANADGVIDVHDDVYSKLRLWRDTNGDGVNQSGESLSMADAGVKSISLAHSAGGRLDPFGNVIADDGAFTRADGRKGRIADAWLRQLG